jgi:ABC-type antimicrobial peptide transport system permease subunit
MRAVVRGALVLSAIGAAIGSALALGLFAVFAAVIEILPMFGVAPFVLATAVVLLATALAASVPSLRAARIDPAAALRAE